TPLLKYPASPSSESIKLILFNSYSSSSSSEGSELESEESNTLAFISVDSTGIVSELERVDVLLTSVSHLLQFRSEEDFLKSYWESVRQDHQENEKVKVQCTDDIFVCDGEVQIGTGNYIIRERSFEQPEEKPSKRRKSEEDKFPDNVRMWSPDHVKKFLESRMDGSDFNKDDINKLRSQDLTGKAFLHLTEEKLTRRPGLYELKPSPVEGIMELVEELKEKLGE
ncbi:472_t:CDS:2, partial [Ambispora leptoticha]